MPSGTIIMPSGTIIMPFGPIFYRRWLDSPRASPAARGGVMRGSLGDRTSQDDRSPRATSWRSRGAGSPGEADPGANLASFGKKSGQMVPDGIIMVPDGINALY